MKVRIVIYPDPEGGFTAEVPALPGCVTEGETREELLANVREAMEAILLGPDPALVGRGPPLEDGGFEEEVDL
jgi:hypothetical protein